MKRKGRKEAGYEEPEQPQASRAEVARVVKPILGKPHFDIGRRCLFC